ncbi:RNA polymerase sigma-70 factor [Pedobacter nutrimenti]|uniref:RNA polymerase sigma factor n=1 Tax=Pedobacter nutrimenti TaxID=1241337 RepID=UPI00292D7DC3|nr:RNA polymerase sigma-70 factor [Pedobacter nutrimenti]
MKSCHIEDNPELLREFQMGSERAFNQVFTHFYPLLCVYANRILREPDIGQDFVQESLITVWNRRTDFDSIYKIKAFLYTCVRNACLKQLDKEKVRSKYESSFDTNEPLDDQSLLKDIIHAEVISRIFSQVDTLPEQCRKVIYMTFKEDKKPKEISEELGLTVSTINSQKMRGLILLRRKLSDKD